MFVGVAHCNFPDFQYVTSTKIVTTMGKVVSNDRKTVSAFPIGNQGRALI